ncbi:MAG: hypothetical protein KBC57_08695 [Neisseriaceae bacterium]|nr:hypothetical protein [Neisseriaceae bacterium]MBP6862423.1 hypothetical protein [Neisseriaceae bacterium]
MKQPFACASIEDYLGKAEHRFFGLGYRRVFYDARDLSLSLHPDSTRQRGLTARISITYPHDWSLKKGDDLRPHLSSVDMLILCPQFCEVFLTHALDLNEVARQKLWLKSIKLKPGLSAQEDLTNLDVTLTLVRTTKSPNRADRSLSVFNCHIAKMQARCEIEHPNGAFKTNDAHYATPATLLGTEADRYYGAAFKNRGQHITDVTHQDSPTLSATATLQLPLSQPYLAQRGLEGAYQPQATYVDCFVTHLQLAQTLMYELDGITRANSETLWMLRTEISTPHPFRPLTDTAIAVATITDSQRLQVEADSWRYIDIEGGVADIQIKCSLGHKIPPQPPTHPLRSIP